MTFHSCVGSIQRRDAAEAGKQQCLENNLTFRGLQRRRLSLASTCADCEAACIIELLRDVARGCRWLVWPLVPVSSLRAWVSPLLSCRSAPKQKRQRSCWCREMWLPLSDRSWFYTVQVGVNFLYLFDVWASDPTQTLAKRGTCDVTTCSSLHLQPALTCILFETKAFAGDPHVPWSAFVWQLDERLLVLFFKSGDFDWEHQNVFELDCSFLAVSSQKLAIVSPSLKHGHDSWSRLRTSPICESLVECFLMQRRAERGGFQGACVRRYMEDLQQLLVGCSQADKHAGLCSPLRGLAGHWKAGWYCRVQFADVRRNKAHTGCTEESNGSRTLFAAIDLS